MPICKDPLLTHLKTLGMNVVYPPRSNLMPLELMLRKGKKLSRWGETSEAFLSERQLPDVKANTTVNSIEGHATASHDLSVGLSILTTIFGQMGAKIGLKASYKSAKKLKFVYEGVTSNSCDPLQIDKCINSGTLDDNAVSTADYLKSDSLYVVSEVFQSNKIRVEAQDENGASIEVDVPEIQQVGSANIKVNVSANDKGVLVYEGDTPVTFGIRAYQIDYVNAKFKLKQASSSIGARNLNDKDTLVEAPVLYRSLNGDLDFEFI